MATNQSKHLSLFRVVVGDHYWAIYDKRIDEQVSGDPKARVNQLVHSGFPTTGDRPRPNPERPYRYLDIPEAERSGDCTYAFYLDTESENTAPLRFIRGEPFYLLPLNSETSESFLTDFRMEYGNEGVWASFSCDLDAVRNSRLAERIRAIDPDEEHHHDPVLTIPFCFNVYDLKLKASPWVVPRYSDNEARALPNFFVHGSVHPTDVAFLSIAL